MLNAETRGEAIESVSMASGKRGPHLTKAKWTSSWYSDKGEYRGVKARRIYSQFCFRVIRNKLSGECEATISILLRLS